MAPRRSQNLDMLATVAKGLKGLKEKVVFVGGATIELYMTHQAAPEARATDDVDCVVELAKRTQYYDLEDELRKLGFEHPIDRKGPLCRWDYRGIKVDVMPTEGKILGFTNQWYPAGIRHAERAKLPDGQEISIFTAPFLLASKVEAFLDRGKGDFMASPDMEDIIAVLDGCTELKGGISRAPKEIRTYLKGKFEGFLADEAFLDSVQGHVRYGEGSLDRANRVISLMEEIVRL